MYVKLWIAALALALPGRGAAEHAGCRSGHGPAGGRGDHQYRRLGRRPATQAAGVGLLRALGSTANEPRRRAPS